MKKFFKYTFSIPFIIVLMITFTNKAYASQVCLYENDNNGDYAFLYFGEEFDSVVSSLPDNVAIEYHKGNDIYYSGKHLSKNIIKEEYYHIPTINLMNDSHSQRYGGIILVNTTSDAAYTRFDAYAYDTNDTQKSIYYGLMQENKNFSDLSTFIACISFDIDDEESMYRAYINASRYTYFQGLFEKKDDSEQDGNSGVVDFPTDYENLCSTDKGVQDAVRIIGYVVAVIRWIAPLIIIVLGMIDFGKAVISSDEKAVSKASSALLRRIIAGVVIFLIPTLILAILNFIELTGGLENNNTFKDCTKCILNVNDCAGTSNNEGAGDKTGGKSNGSVGGGAGNRVNLPK